VKADADKPIAGGSPGGDLGSAGLAEGFSLIGAEVHPDADPAKVEEVLGQLVRDGSEALVLLESQPGPCRRPLVEPLAQRRRAHRGDRTAALSAPHDYAPAVDEVVRAVLGPEALK
jgi:hypothetical protein